MASNLKSPFSGLRELSHTEIMTSNNIHRQTEPNTHTHAHHCVSFPLRCLLMVLVWRWLIFYRQLWLNQKSRVPGNVVYADNDSHTRAVNQEVCFVCFHGLFLLCPSSYKAGSFLFNSMHILLLFWTKLINNPLTGNVSQEVELELE